MKKKKKFKPGRQEERERENVDVFFPFIEQNVLYPRDTTPKWKRILMLRKRHTSRIAREKKNEPSKKGTIQFKLLRKGMLSPKKALK